MTIRRSSNSAKAESAALVKYGSTLIRWLDTFESESEKTPIRSSQINYNQIASILNNFI